MCECARGYTVVSMAMARWVLADNEADEGPRGSLVVLFGDVSPGGVIGGYP